ncbi:MAG: ATP synthase F1 subunit delta [Clostridiales bacterium]|nr:ATP synthase F1 subunit delta [Clostridiales bacterium]
MIDTVGYGKALFELTAENGTDTQVREELETVRTALREQPDYVTLLDTPAVATEEKLALLREAFGAMDPMVLNFLSLLCEKRACYLFSACADVFDTCYDETHNLLRATAITAVAMQERQCEALKAKLESITGKTVLLTNRIDETLIGGMTLRYGGVQLDDSIRSRLDKLRRSLSDTIV